MINKKPAKNPKQKVITPKLQQQIVDLTGKWKRALADYQNLEKNVEDSKKQWIDFASGQLILKLLPVLENLTKSAKHLDNEGLNLTIEQFKKALFEEGLEEIKVEPRTTEFNADTMECIQVEKGKQETVLEVLEKGYKLKEKVLKPAKVIVGKS